MDAPGKSILGRKYGARPPDRYHRLSISPPSRNADTEALAVDWRHLMRPVRDQGSEGDCFAFAVAALKEFNCAVFGGSTAPLGGYLSPAYLAWRTRLAEGTFPQDAGASVADTMGVLESYGVCPETFLPYEQDASEIGSPACDVAALPYRCGTPCTVAANVPSFRAVLAAKKVIAIGFSCYESFERTGQGGIVPPVPPGDPLLGGHAVLVVGYDARGFIIRNSWGESWGDGGYCYFSPEYLDEIFEAWTTG